MSSYFIGENNIVSKRVLHIRERQKRKPGRYGIYSIKSLKVGDILCILYRNKGIVYQFEGICLGIKKRLLASCSLILRNVIFGIGIEYTFGYYYNRLFNLQILDYKRKMMWYRRGKLYYLRNRANIQSKVK